MSQMTSLVGIPTELLLLICGELGNGDIIRVCRSSKYLFSAVHPLIFRHITISRDPSASPDFPHKFISPLLFILRNPSYAVYIKTVDIPRLRYDDCVFYPDTSAGGNPLPLSTQDTALVKAAIQECSYPEDDGFFPAASDWEFAVFEEVHLAAIVALTLAQCTHLESLTVHSTFVPDLNRWFSHVFRLALSMRGGSTRPSSFHKLTNFTLSEIPPELDWQLFLPSEVIHLSFRLPSVKSLTYNAAIGKTWERPYNTFVVQDGKFGLPSVKLPPATNLTTLRLDFHRPAPADSFEPLLRLTPNLQSLTCNCKLTASGSPLDLSALRQGLHQVSQTLTRLVVNFGIFADENPDPELMAPVTWDGLGSLGYLTALADLEISLAAVFGKATPEDAPPLADVLPRGLKRLVISDDLIVSHNDWIYLVNKDKLSPAEHDAFYKWPGESVVALLTAFFTGAHQTATPLLQEFVLNVEEKGRLSREYWAEGGERDKLRQLIEGQGIRCSVHVGRAEGPEPEARWYYVGT